MNLEISKEVPNDLKEGDKIEVEEAVDANMYKLFNLLKFMLILKCEMNVTKFDSFLIMYN